MKTNTKRNLLTFTAIGAIAVAGYAFAAPQDGEGGGGERRGHWRGHGFAMAHMVKSLNLTSDQQAKVQPLLDQARPQIVAIHKEAMEKTHAIMDKTMTQIRPILTPEQQKKFDAMQKARQDMRNAAKEFHDAMQQ